MFFLNNKGKSYRYGVFIDYDYDYFNWKFLKIISIASLIFLGIYGKLKNILVYRKYRFRLQKFICSDNILPKIFFILQINFLVLF